MSFFKKSIFGVSDKIGTLIGDTLSENSHKATETVVNEMDLLKSRASKLANTDFKTGKGILFEYIESAKFNQNAAKKGEIYRAFTTEALGDPHAAADIVIKDGGATVKEIQAKFTDKAKDSVFDHAGGQNIRRVP